MRASSKWFCEEGATMKDYRVSFNDAEKAKNHHVKVKASGIVPAIEKAQQKAFEKYGTACFVWDIWKVEMV